MKEHRPVPGPDYWEYRCTVCGKDVVRHQRRPLGVVLAQVTFAGLMACWIAWAVLSVVQP